MRESMSNALVELGLYGMEVFDWFVISCIEDTYPD